MTIWQEGTSLIEIVSAKMIAMDSTEGKFMRWKHLWATVPLAGVIILTGCGEHLVAPSPVTGAQTNVLAGPNRSATETMSLQIARSFSDTKYVKIFDNFAALPSGKYWGESYDVIVGGSGNGTFADNEVAGAFTPSGNHTATVIEAAILNAGLQGYGSSGFTLSLNKDDKGVPGKAIISASLPGLPSNGLGWCCALVIGKIPNGLALSGGKQYWLVLNGQGAQSSDGAGWAMNATDQLHPFLDAAYCAYASKCSNGPGWYPFKQDLYGTGVAFAVLGSN